MRILLKTVMILSCLNVFSLEMLKNGDFNGAVRAEAIPEWKDDICEVSLFTEPSSWNKCLKFKLNKMTVGSNNSRKFNGFLLIGKTAERPGVEAKPNTTYQFSFQACGNLPRLVIKGALWEKKRTKLWDTLTFTQTSLASIAVQKEWTTYSGTFKTGPDTGACALMFQMWGDSSQEKNFQYENGQYVLLDNVSLQEKASLDAVFPPQTKVHVPETRVIGLPAQINGGFFLLGTDMKADPSSDMAFSVKLEDEKFIIHTENRISPRGILKATVRENGAKIWADDVVEIFFGPVVPDREITQFAVSAGNGRYCGNGSDEVKNYDSWKAAARKTESGWIADFEIPLSLLGYKGTPFPGSSILFNIARSSGKQFITWAPLKAKFNEPDHFNRIVFGTQEDFKRFTLETSLKDCPESLKKELAAFCASKASLSELAVSAADMASKINNEKQGKSPYLLGRISTTGKYTYPVEPDPKDILRPASKIVLRAAVNETVSLPLTLTNRGRAAAFRVTLHPGVPMSSSEPFGLGGGFPVRNVELREAVAIRSDHTKSPGQIFDALPLMNQANTLRLGERETGILWFSFRCHGVKPGKYTGMIRVVPLAEPGTLSRRIKEGGFQDFPVELEVLNITLDTEPFRPIFLMTGGDTEEIYRAQAELGGRMTLVSPWKFRFKFDEEGNILNPDLPEVVGYVKQRHEWFHKYKLRTGRKFMIGLGVYMTFYENFMNKKIKEGSPEWRNAWKNNLLAINSIMKKAGISEKEYSMEIFDEPKGINFKRDIEVCKIAKETLPNVRMDMTWAAEDFGYTPEKIKEFIDVVDNHMFWLGLMKDPKIRQLMKTIKEKNHTYSYYQCSTNLLESLYRYYRLHAWQGWENGSNEVAFYIFLEIPWGEEGAPDWKIMPAGAIAYRADNEAIPSIRQEAFRQGVTDMSYFALLKKLAAGESKKAVEARRFLENASFKVLNEFVHDPGAADRMREEAIRYILELQK